MLFTLASFYDVTHYMDSISIGTFLSNIESFFLPIWLILVFIRLSAFLYISALMFGQLFKIKNFEYLIPALAAICLLIGMFPESSINTSLGFKARVQYIVGSGQHFLGYALFYGWQHCSRENLNIKMKSDRRHPAFYMLPPKVDKLKNKN